MSEIQTETESEIEIANELYKENDIQMKLQQKIEIANEEKDKMKQKLKKYNDKKRQRGVCYLSKIPPYMQIQQVRKLLEQYHVERIYFSPEDPGKRKWRIKKGGNRLRKYTEGWIEFKNKRVARYVAGILNNAKMYPMKKHGFFAEDVWSIQYLPKFKWENLTEKFAYDARVKKDKLSLELGQAAKEKELILDRLDQSKFIHGIINSKNKKIKKQIDENDNVNDNDSNNVVNSTTNMKTVDTFNQIKRQFKQKKPKI